MIWSVHFIISMRNSVPYVTAPPKTVDQIIDALQLPDKGVLWDLGCGDGRILKAALKAKPALEVAGVDNNPIPLQLARWNVPSAKLVQGDILDTKFAGVDRVYAYLGPKLMSALEPRFLSELPRGARVVALQFRLPQRTPDQVITLKHGKKYAAKLYVYDY
ncbi:MAG: putative methyltransferase [Candidatus Saccharibacteria bacterium]|nr:putative methyltransferase [Candidatus Saccharibacteria bacterium]